MVALSLATVLAGVAFTLVSSTSSRSRSLSESARLRGKADAVMGLVTGDLAGAFVPPDPSAYPFFAGEEGWVGDHPACKVDFTTTSAMPFDPDAPFGDLAEVGYVLSFSGSGAGTLYRREEVPPRDPEGEGGESIKVCDGVTAFSLRYFDGRDWFPSWDAADLSGSVARGRIPREVAVAVTIEGKDGESVSLSTRVSLPMAQARP